MAVPAYTHDLVDWIGDTDSTAWGEFLTMANGGNPDEVDAESAIQGSNAYSQATNTTAAFSMGRVLAASVTLATNDVFLVWHGHGVATAMLSYASGGLRLVVATDLSNWKAWAVGGNDVPPFPYGKWVNNPVDPTIAGEYTAGTPPAALTFFSVGSAGILGTAVLKGQPHVVDMIRYGRAQSRFTGGESANYCVFSGYAALNDASGARWGLISVTSGGYLWKGLMKIGLSTVATTNRARTSNVATLTTGAAHGCKVGDTLTMTGIGGTGYNATATVTTVPTTTTFTYANTGSDEGSTADTGGSINGVADFRDSNTTIFIQDTRKVYATFNKIEIRNASTNVAWSGINFVNPAPSTNASDGDLEVVDNATVVLTACTFTDMNTFILLGNTDFLGCQFLRCNTITSGGGLMTGTSCLTPTVAANTSAVIWNINSDPNGDLDNMTFSKGTNAHHAIEFGTSSPLTMTLTGISFTGFSASQNNDASIFHIKRTSGAETVTINLIGCSSDVSFATSYRTDGALVSIVQDPVTFSVTAKDLDTGAVIENARVMVPVTDNTNFPYQASVTITSSGTTATVTHGTHGLADNDNILIAGADQDEYNGAYTINVTGVSTYTYTMLGDPADTATGTITATMVLLNGFTNASGVITDSRTYSAAQPVSGWVRRHTYGPSYTSATWTESTSTLTKTGAFTGFSGTFLLTITAGTNMTPGIYLATYVNANDVTLPGGAGSADSSNVAFTIGAQPLYRQAPVAGEVSNTNGLSVTVFLQPDE